MDRVNNLTFFSLLVIFLILISCNPKLEKKNSDHTIHLDTSYYFYLNQDTFLISVHKITDSINNIDYPPIRYGEWKYYYPNYIIKQIEKYNEYGNLLRRSQYYKNGTLSYDFILNQNDYSSVSNDTSFVYKYFETGKVKYFEVFYSTQQNENFGTLRIKKYFSKDEILEREIIDSIDNSVEIKYYVNGQKSSYRELSPYEGYQGKIMEWDTTGNLILDTSIHRENMIYY